MRPTILVLALLAIFLASIAPGWLTPCWFVTVMVSEPCAMATCERRTVEVATMVPYLAAIGILTVNDVSFVESGVLLLAYCTVMVLPAFVLLLLRTVLASAIEPLLARRQGLLQR